MLGRESNLCLSTPKTLLIPLCHSGNSICSHFLYSSCLSLALSITVKTQVKCGSFSEIGKVRPNKQNDQFKPHSFPDKISLCLHQPVSPALTLVPLAQTFTLAYLAARCCHQERSSQLVNDQSLPNPHPASPQLSKGDPILPYCPSPTMGKTLGTLFPL